MRPAARPRRIAVPATPATTARTDGGIELQAGFACGASVYDRGHGGQQRGYGAVLKAAGTADDGTARWYVDWAAGGRTGGRTTAIKETYLEVALIHNSARCPPTAIGQGVLVVLGNFKNSTGVIVGKVGTCAGGRGCGGEAAGGSRRVVKMQPALPAAACCPLTPTAAVPAMLQCGEMWRCKLDGAGKGCQPFLSDYLHATAQPAPDAAILAPFTPTVLATALAADQVPAYLEGMQFDADNPIDLRRKKPDSKAWFDVLTGRQDIGDLPDDDLRQLHYVAAGGLPACSGPAAPHRSSAARRSPACAQQHRAPCRRNRQAHQQDWIAPGR